MYAHPGSLYFSTTLQRYQLKVDCRLVYSYNQTTKFVRSVNTEKRYLYNPQNRKPTSHSLSSPQCCLSCIKTIHELYISFYSKTTFQIINLSCY